MEDSAEQMSDDAGLSSGGILVAWLRVWDVVFFFFFAAPVQLSVVCKSHSGWRKPDWDVCFFGNFFFIFCGATATLHQLTAHSIGHMG